jgi:hypothetical protein
VTAPSSSGTEVPEDAAAGQPTRGASRPSLSLLAGLAEAAAAAMLLRRERAAANGGRIAASDLASLRNETGAT